ncbi:MAG: hypothetical protein ACRC1D_02925, partial [Culicoidibacterales bacterium]
MAPWRFITFNKIKSGCIKTNQPLKDYKTQKSGLATAFSVYFLVMKKKLQENYTTLTTRYQLTLNLDLMTYIDKNDPVRLLSGILEGL